MQQFEVPRKKQEELMRELLEYISQADYQLSNPAIMEGSYEIMTKYINNKDPYKEIKEFYNTRLLSMYSELKEMISKSNNPFDTALSMAIIGNLIDFNATHTFSLEILKKTLMNTQNVDLQIDDSKLLYSDLFKAKSLLYIGDNCGEIVLDKLLIEEIHKDFPDLKIYYGVRGKPIVNDVTIKDASMIGMQEICEVIDNGNGALGTVLPLCSEEFKEVFAGVDVVLSKGQGNFESLYEEERSNIYFNFMVKCPTMAKIVGVKELSIVCMKNK